MMSKAGLRGTSWPGDCTWVARHGLRWRCVGDGVGRHAKNRLFVRWFLVGSGSAAGRGLVRRWVLAMA